MNADAAPAAPAVGLKSPVHLLRGVGPQRARHLKRLGIETLSDLLRHYPRAWEDRRETPSPGIPADGAPVVARARVLSARAIPTGRTVAVFKARVHVPAWGREVEAVWFKRHSHRYDVFQRLKSEARPGAELWLVGRAQATLLGVREIQVDEHYQTGDPDASLHVGRPVAAYPLTEGISQRFMRELMSQAMDQGARVPEMIPRRLLARRRLLAGDQALRAIHAPRTQTELEEARRRLAYEELLLLDLAWTLKSRQMRRVDKGFGYEIRRHLLTPFRRQLGFELTGAQRRVINEIFSDMQRPCPMTRLLQGDVGSGKTVVAIAALLLAVENGYQGAFMAPTEILAEQHYMTMSRFLRGLPVRLRLLTSRVPAREKARVHEALRSGESDIVVGTHALLEGDVAFARLRAIVIDEQHRFGVRQRTTLRLKGPPLDMLVMTATPIPRTLALALYGDLAVSTLDEMPPGRAPIRTSHGTEAQAFERVRAEASRSRQAYVVYPIISESETLDLKAAKAEFERLRDRALKGLRVALIHGRMPGRRKAAIMEGFLEGRWDVLVATPVIEVGIDVPNATVIVVMNADRFGLASLHQLRGRVGRGGHPSECWLVAAPRTPDAQRRLRTLCETSDGFRIGEEDLKIRGPGEILGTSQHGDLSLRLADLFRDADLQGQTRADAQEILDADCALLSPEHEALRERLRELYEARWNAIDLA